MTNGGSEFNEVFFNDVFVPDDDVVGPVDGGWTVARATLGNDSVSIGGGDGGMSLPGSALIEPFDANPERLEGGAVQIGRASCREGVCPYVSISVVARSIKKKNTKNKTHRTHNETQHR